jgi:hypothetical protein
MQRFVDAGVRHFVIAPLSHPTETVETIAREILPAIRALR